VMFDGEIVFDTDPAQCDSATIGRYMAGHARAADARPC
jgi:hypothetical protein